MRKFKCPNCGGHSITQVTTGGIRKSEVVAIDNIDPTKFLCSNPKFFGFKAGDVYYECAGCGDYLGDIPGVIIKNSFANTYPIPESPTPESDVSATYRINPLKKCASDSPSVRETIDMINFIINSSNEGKVSIENNVSKGTKLLLKVIKERPYLFEKVY